MTDLHRVFQARKLFGEWTGVIHPELLGAMWNALSREDRKVWLDRAAEQD